MCAISDDPLGSARLKYYIHVHVLEISRLDSLLLKAWCDILLRLNCSLDPDVSLHAD